MAFLTDRERGAGDGTGGNRGQLLFITAIGLAVLLVVLSATLNATVDTGSVGPEGSATDPSSTAIRYHADARDAIGTNMARVNRENGSNYSERNATLADRVEEWSALSARHAAADGTWVDTTLVETTEGTRIAQTNRSRNLTNVDGNENWTLVSDADRLRAVHLQLDSDSLEEVAGAEESVTSKEVFTILLDGDDDTARVYVYENDSGSAVVSVDTGDGDIDGTCEADLDEDGYFDLDITDGTVSGSDCPALHALHEIDGSYAVTFENGHDALGTYSLVVDVRMGEIDAGDFHSEDDATGPAANPAIYDSTVEETYETRTLDATIELRIAPGEFDD